jgi:hypothetical protein
MITPPRPTPPDAAEQVAALSRRTAHAVYALHAYIRENTGPAYANEVVLFDREAISTQATATSLANAEKLGLVEKWPSPGVSSLWTMTPHGGDLSGALEDRFLADTEEADR